MQENQQKQPCLRITLLALGSRVPLCSTSQGWQLHCHVGSPQTPAAKGSDGTVALKWRLQSVIQLDVIGPKAGYVFRYLGRWIVVTTSEPLSHQYLLQQVSVAIQRGNATAILATAESGIISIHYQYI